MFFFINRETQDSLSQQLATRGKKITLFVLSSLPKYLLCALKCKNINFYKFPFTSY